jgi:hypothetical protein
MSGDARLNRMRKPARSKPDLSAMPIVLFALAGIAFSLVFSHYDPWTPLQLLAP